MGKAWRPARYLSVRRALLRVHQNGWSIHEVPDGWVIINRFGQQIVLDSYMCCSFAFRDFTICCSCRRFWNIYGHPVGTKPADGASRNFAGWCRQCCPNGCRKSICMNCVERSLICMYFPYLDFSAFTFRMTGFWVFWQQLFFCCGNMTFFLFGNMSGWLRQHQCFLK